MNGHGEQLLGAVRDFEVRARGTVNLVEQWKLDHDNVRLVWKVEDLTRECNQTFELADQLLAHYQAHGKFPNPAVRFSYFADRVADFLAASIEVSALAAAISERYVVEGYETLRIHNEKFRALLDEEGLTTRAFAAGLTPE